MHGNCTVFQDIFTDRNVPAGVAIPEKIGTKQDCEIENNNKKDIMQMREYETSQ